MAMQHGDDNDKLRRYQVLSVNKSPVYFPQGSAVFAKQHNPDKVKATRGAEGSFGAYLSQAEVLTVSNLNAHLKTLPVSRYADVAKIHRDWRFIGFVEVAVKRTEMNTLLTFGFYGEMMKIFDYWDAPSTIYECGFCFGLEKTRGAGNANETTYLQIRPVRTIQHTAFPDPLCLLDHHGYSRGLDLAEDDREDEALFADYDWAEGLVSPVYRAAIPNTQSHRLTGEDKFQRQQPRDKTKVQKQPKELFLSSGNVETDTLALNDCGVLELVLIKGKSFLNLC